MAEDIPSESLHEYCRKLGLQHRDNNDNSNMAAAISADLGEQTTGEAGEGTSDPISASHTKLQDVSKDKYDCKNCDKHFANSRQFQKHKCSTSTPEEAELAEAESGSPKPKRKSKKRQHKAKKDGKDPVRAKRVKKGTEAAEALLSAEQPEETVAKSTNKAQVDEDTSEVHLTDHTYIRDDLEGVVVIGEIPNSIPQEGSSNAEQSPPKVPDTNEELALKDPAAEQSGGADPAAEQSGEADPTAEQSGAPDPTAEQSGVPDPTAEQSGVPDPTAEQSGGPDATAEQSEGPAAEEKKEGKKRKYTFKKEEEFCPHCQKGFHSEKRLAKHVKICEKNLVCDVCGEDFNKSGQHARSKYKQHCYTHMEKKPHPCTVCSESFVIKQDLEKHKLTHPELFSPQTCMECGDVLNSVKLLKKHMWKHTLPRRPTWTCEKCKYKFVQHTVYEKHILTCDRKLNCEVCGKAFTCLTKNLKTRYQEHMFTHTGEKPYKCQFCERGFRDRSTRKKHERSHTGEKPYPCTLCDRAFSQLRILRHHIRTHTGEKPFQCELCELRFAKQCNLKYHMRVHTKEKPYTCQVCNKSFTQSGTYYKHMRRQCHENNKATGKEPAKEVPETAREHEDVVSTEVLQEIPISSDEITIIVSHGDLGAEGTALATIDVEQITSILASCS